MCLPILHRVTLPVPDINYRTYNVGVVMGVALFVNGMATERESVLRTLSTPPDTPLLHRVFTRLHTGSSTTELSSAFVWVRGCIFLFYFFLGEIRCSIAEDYLIYR